MGNGCPFLVGTAAAGMKLTTCLCVVSGFEYGFNHIFMVFPGTTVYLIICTLSLSVVLAIPVRPSDFVTDSRDF